MHAFRPGRSYTLLLLVIWIGLGKTDASGASITGAAREVASDIKHQNGNVYDQVLLEGVSATVRADREQVVRISFIDLNDDIVQAEFSGVGALTVELAFPSGPAPAAKYLQPDVRYMRGHAALSITGSDASTNVSVFSVGRVTAVNQALFPPGVTYDGVADIAGLRIIVDPQNPGGFSTFGAIRMGNAHLFATTGITGIQADRVYVQGAVLVGNVSAFDEAQPVLVFGGESQFGSLLIAGGDLFQPNSRAIRVKGMQHVSFIAGTRSDGTVLPAQPNRGRLEWETPGPTAQQPVNPVGSVAVAPMNLAGRRGRRA